MAHGQAIAITEGHLEAAREVWFRQNYDRIEQARREIEEQHERNMERIWAEYREERDRLLDQFSND